MLLERIFIYTLTFALTSFLNLIDPAKIVQIDTRLGSIKIKLYDDTPIHRDNFLKLVKSGFYDSLLFHRVIKDFMIQGGDPNSKNAKPGTILGDGDPGYTLPSEILPTHFHHRGVIAAAREGDNVNPSHRSSGSQFYIVQGKKFTDEEILNLQTKLNDRSYQLLFNNSIKQITDSLTKLSIKSLPDSIKAIALRKTNKIYKASEFSAEAKRTYKEIGGTPHLDGAYTIFGEVIEGIDIVEKISLLPTDSNNRPLIDLRMKIKLIE
jgi:peptidylprolyl isomerase